MSNDGAAEVQDMRSQLQRVEHLRGLGAQAARRAIRRRNLAFDAWAALFVPLVFMLVNAWAPALWLWILAATLPIYIAHRALDRLNAGGAVHARMSRRSELVSAAFGLAGLLLVVPLYLFVVVPAFGTGLLASAVAAVALLIVWTLSDWWITR